MTTETTNTDFDLESLVNELVQSLHDHRPAYNNHSWAMERDKLIPDRYTILAATYHLTVEKSGKCINAHFFRHASQLEYKIAGTLIGQCIPGEFISEILQVLSKIDSYNTKPPKQGTT